MGQKEGKANRTEKMDTRTKRKKKMEVTKMRL